MTNDYIFVRIKKEDYLKIQAKKDGLKKDMEAILGKKISFKNPQFFHAVAHGIIEINPESAVELVNLKKFKGGIYG